MNRRPGKRKRGKREAAFEKVGALEEGAAGRGSCVLPGAQDSVPATRTASGEFALNSQQERLLVTSGVRRDRDGGLSGAPHTAAAPLRTESCFPQTRTGNERYTTHAAAKPLPEPCGKWGGAV